MIQRGIPPAESMDDPTESGKISPARMIELTSPSVFPSLPSLRSSYKPLYPHGGTASISLAQIAQPLLVRTTITLVK